jgi:SAM-dependent methyltransferase
MGVVAVRPPDTEAYYTDAYYSKTEPSSSGYSEYPLVATHSLAWVAELIRVVRSAGRVLDVGCADGHLLRMLGPGFELYGIEVNDNLRAQCQKAGIRMLGADICEPRLPAGYGGSFDVVSAIAVLEHVPDIRAALEAIRVLLAAEGVLIFELPLLSPTEDNRVWFTSSLEHVYYPTPEGLAFLFEAVFELPLIGREIPIRDYGSTFVGLATRSATRHRELDELLRHLLDTPISLLESRAERDFRFFFDLVHVAEPSAESVALLAELDPARVTPELLHRLATLWGLDLARGAGGFGPSQGLASSAVEDASRVLADRDARIRELQAALARKDYRLQELQEREAIQVRSGAEAESALAASNLDLARLREDLDQIVSSRSWQVVVRLWRFRLAFRRSVEKLRRRLSELIGPAS